MNNGIRSLPRYQHGGPHPEPPFDAEAFREAVRQGWTVNPRPTAAEQAEEGIRSMVELAADNEPVWESLERFWASPEGAIPLTADEEKLLSRGLGSLPQEPSWTRELGIPERGGGVHSLSAKQIAELTPQEQLDRMLLQDFDRLAPVRAAILETPPRTPGGPSRLTADVREQFARRNPAAPTGPTYEKGYGELFGYRLAKERPGSYESYFPDVEGKPFGTQALLEIMDTDITEQEILQALDDPMFGGPLSGTASNAEISERVYARRYVNLRMGSPHSETRRQVTRHFMQQVPREFPEDAVRFGGRNLSDVEFERAMGERRKRLLLEHELTRLRDPSLPERNPYRTFFNEFAKPGERRPRHRSLPFRAGQAVRGAGITALKAIRNRLPSVIGAGLATAAASHPASAAVDIALSPTPMGSGDMPKRDLLTDEQKIRYYQDRLNLQKELGVGQHYPSFFQPSRERSGPSIRPSYPMGR